MKVDVTPEQLATTTPLNEAQDDSFKLKFCTVCASNNNRYVSHLLKNSPYFVTRDFVDISTSSCPLCYLPEACSEEHDMTLSSQTLN